MKKNEISKRRTQLIKLFKKKFISCISFTKSVMSNLLFITVINEDMQNEYTLLPKVIACPSKSLSLMFQVNKIQHLGM